MCSFVVTTLKIQNAMYLLICNDGHMFSMCCVIDCTVDFRLFTNALNKQATQCMGHKQHNIMHNNKNENINHCIVFHNTKFHNITQPADCKKGSSTQAPFNSVI